MFGENLKMHNERLREVLDRMRKYNMKLQLDKCEFLRKGCLGLAGYYRRFIPNFSKIAKPLMELVKKNTPYI